ncbi:hypothetical protein ACFZBZ_42375 [Streptomyces sp. NPDC008196]|uniref:hypothetical protein n=1 Tax=Streptomyces sp. NPDC008196 TaxID=3364819 RepID=UPI0036F00ABE
MSEISIALISSGSALAASAITGVLTWLAGRSHLVRQLADQKDARHEQYRRDVYAGCLESLSALITSVQTYAARVVAGDSEAEGAADEVMAGQATHLRHSAALQLVGPETLTRSYDQAHSAIMDLAEFAQRMPPVGDPSRPEDPYRASLPYINRIGEKFESFGREARLVLGFG